MGEGGTRDLTGAGRPSRDAAGERAGILTPGGARDIGMAPAEIVAVRGRDIVEGGVDDGESFVAGAAATEPPEVNLGEPHAVHRRRGWSASEPPDETNTRTLKH